MWWMGITGPPNLPSFVLETWNNALVKVVKNPEFVSKAENMGYVLFFKNSQEVRNFAAKEVEEAKRLWGLE